jgi:hypothetical protein
MAITISGSGITSANIADGTIVNADVADVAASKLTGALPAIDGSALTNLPGGGKVLQVVHNSTTVDVTNNSQTFANTGLESVITPISTSSKILIIISQNVHKSGSGQIDQMQLNITRNGTQLVQWTSEVLHDNGALGHFDIYASQTYLDSPSSTSALTYRTQFRRRLSTSATMRVQYAGSRSSITLMEVAQ